MWPVNSHITATAGSGKSLAVCSGIARNRGGWDKRLDEGTSALPAGYCRIGDAGRHLNLMSQFLTRKAMEPRFYLLTARLNDILEAGSQVEKPVNRRAVCLFQVFARSVRVLLPRTTQARSPRVLRQTPLLLARSL